MNNNKNNNDSYIEVGDIRSSLIKNVYDSFVKKRKTNNNNNNDNNDKFKGYINISYNVGNSDICNFKSINIIENYIDDDTDILVPQRNNLIILGEPINDNNNNNNDDNIELIDLISDNNDCELVSDECEFVTDDCDRDSKYELVSGECDRDSECELVSDDDDCNKDSGCELVTDDCDRDSECELVTDDCNKDSDCELVTGNCYNNNDDVVIDIPEEIFDTKTSDYFFDCFDMENSINNVVPCSSPNAFTNYTDEIDRSSYYHYDSFDSDSDNELQNKFNDNNENKNTIQKFSIVALSTAVIMGSAWFGMKH